MLPIANSGTKMGRSDTHINLQPLMPRETVFPVVHLRGECADNLM